jgi:hypothetical protein
VFLALLPLVVLAGAMTLPQLSRQGPTDEATADPGDGQGLDERVLALVLIAGVTAVLLAAGGAPLPVAVVLVTVGAPVAAAAFLRLVPPGTVRLAPGMPAAVLVRGILTFAFFGVDAYVSLTFQEVRDQPTWVAGAALTAATITWSIGAWVQERLVHRVGPRRLVGTGFVCVAIGILGMFGALGPLPVPVSIALWSVAGLGTGLSYSPLSVTVLALAAPGREGSASAALQLSDVLGVSLGTGVGGVFVALGDASGWAVRSALTGAFLVAVTGAILGVLAARRLPAALPAPR